LTVFHGSAAVANEAQSARATRVRSIGEFLSGMGESG
jgi:hypothetical protein